MTKNQDDWQGFWIGQQPTQTLCVTHESPIGNADEGWHRFLLETAVPGFQAKFKFESQLAEFKAFSAQVRQMHDTLKGTARFESLESNVLIDATMDRFGHVFWSVTLRSQDGDSPQLTFSIEEDQTMLWNVHAKIEDMLDAVTALAIE